MTWYVVDGLDGSGKSTIGEVLRSDLESSGRKVFMVTHPDANKFVGRLEARILKTDMDKLTLIMTTIAYIFDVIESLLRKKMLRDEFDDFVFVRYSMAAAYVPEPFCYKVYRIIEHVLPTPDVRILVDIDSCTAMSRIESRGEDREAFESTDKLHTVRKRMLNLANNGWHILDNSGSLDDSIRQLKDIVG